MDCLHQAHNLVQAGDVKTDVLEIESLILPPFNEG